MHCRFFRLRGLTDLSLEIKEISLIAPYFTKGTLTSVIDLYFKINDNLIVKGSDLYARYKKILLEAESIVLSGQMFQYENYRDRLLLNYAIGFIKNAINEMIERKRNSGR